MKSFDFGAVTFGPIVLCREHFPLELVGRELVTLDDPRVLPIFAASELDSYFTCDVCGEQHTYI